MKNYVSDGKIINAEIDYPASPVVNDPVLVGKIPGVAVTGLDDDDEMRVATKGVFEVEVVGFNGTTDAAVTLGARLYYDTGDEAINVNSSETLFGKALGAVGAGDTDTIPVMLIQG